MSDARPEEDVDPAPDDLELRKRWLDLGAADEARLRDLDDAARSAADAVIDELYDHILSFPGMRRFFDDATQLDHVKDRQREYFLGLTSGTYDAAYAQDRLKVGAAHERAGLDLNWYVGAYAAYLGSVWRRILRADDRDLEDAIETYFSLTKLAFLDMGLAVDTYVRQREQTIRAQENELIELTRRTDERRRLITEIVHAQEEERRRLAGDIHDDSVQAMTAVLLRIGLLGTHIADPEQAGLIQELEQSVRETIARLRRLIVGLVPLELDRIGLVHAIRAVLELLETDFGIRFELRSALTDEPKRQTRTVLFRIVQEAVANARKHSGARMLRVSVEPSGEGVLAQVVDDGVGFDVAARLSDSRPGHLGLAAMRERAELVGGWVEIDSNAGGTAVRAWVPDKDEDRPESTTLQT